MNKTLNFLSFFVCFAPQAQGAPFIDRAVTRETENPHRTGDGFLIRVPFTRHRPTVGLIVGKWRQSGPDANAARYLWLTEDHADAETRAKVRAILARMGAMSRNVTDATIDEARTRYVSMEYVRPTQQGNGPK